jgi:hypothetical protein
LQRLDASEPFEFVGSEKAQELRLERQAELADLVEKQRASVASSTRPGFRPTAP